MPSEPSAQHGKRGRTAAVGQTARMVGAELDADVIVVGAGLAGLVATAELADAGRRVILLDQEPRAVPRRPGVLVVRRAVPRRLARAAPAAASRTPRELAWQDWLGTAGFDRARGPLAARSGPRRTSTSPRARSGPGCTQQGVRFFPVVGWAERGGYSPTATATRCRASTSPGAPGPGVVAPFDRRVRAAVDRGRVHAPVPAPGRRADRRPAASVDGVRGDGAGAERRRAAAWPARATSSATSSSRAQAVIVTSRRHRRQPRPRARAAGPRGSGARPSDMISGVPGPRRRADARHHRGAPAAGSSTATGCGTTPRASTTGTRSGRGTASGSCPARRRCGSTRPASGCPPPLFPGLRHARHARAHHAHDRLRLLAGSCSPRRSSRRSSRSPARSRTPT